MEYLKALSRFDALKEAHDYTERTLENLRREIAQVLSSLPIKRK